MTRPLRARLWLALACGAGTGLVWWLAAGEVGPGRVAAQAPEAAARSARAAAELRAVEEPPELARPSASASTPVAEREPSRAAADEPTPATGPVVVRVQLALAPGETRSFAGWRVDAQSWIEATNETFPHETTAGATGQAEFVFPGFVHVDWLRCVPPPESGLALAFAELHADLEPGESWTETLELKEGGVLGARVHDLSGAPVAGARVHAFSDGMTEELTGWQPGLVHATSGADGRVELPPLPPGPWTLAVEPFAWLQVDPEPWAERATRQLEVGDRLEALDFFVAPLQRMRVRVLDAAERPVVAASVELNPLELHVEGLEARASEPPDPLELFLGRAAPPQAGDTARVWPYQELSWTTDAQGEARVFGLPGRWSLVVTPELGIRGGAGDNVQTEFELPGPDLTVRVPTALVELRGSVVDDALAELADVRVRLVRADGQRWNSRTRSARDGSFVLRGLPRGIEYWLELSHPEYLPVRSTVWVAADVEVGAHALRRAGSVRVQLVDPAGAPLRQKSLSILACRPSEALRPAESAWLAAHPRGSLRTNATGRGEFEGLPPGEIELALRLPLAGLGPGGETQEGVFQRWVLPVGGGEQRLEVDLSAYIAPAPPPQSVHTGVVLDARTGAPLARARVCLRYASSVYLASTDQDGHFRVVGPSGAHALVALHAGYFPAEVLERDWPSGQHEHRFALSPGCRELVVEFVDRDGARLPRVDVAMSSATGARLLAWGRTNGAPFLANGQRIETEGSVVLDALPPGRLRFELTIAGHLLGSGEVDPERTPGPAIVRLDQSLEELRRELEDEDEEDDDDE